MYSAHLLNSCESHGMICWTVALLLVEDGRARIVRTHSGDGSHEACLARVAADAAEYNHSAEVYARMVAA